MRSFQFLFSEEFSKKKYKPCPKFKDFTLWKSFWTWKVATKNPYKFKTQSFQTLAVVAWSPTHISLNLFEGFGLKMIEKYFYSSWYSIESSHKVNMDPCMYEYPKCTFLLQNNGTVFLMPRKTTREGKLMNICKCLMLVIAHKSGWCFPQVKKDNISVWKKDLWIRCEVQKEKILQKK